LGIDTESPGDMYLLRKSSVFTKGLTPNVSLRDYPFISQKILTKEEMAKNAEDCQVKVLNYAFNSPVLIKDFRQFF
jgi:hypothetical protein